MKRFFVLLTGLGLVCTAHAQSLMNEPFSYANGEITSVSSGLWSVHSGSLALNIVDGRALVSQKDGSGSREDVNRLFNGGTSFDPSTDNTSKIYAGFLVNFTALPFSSGTATAGSYFAHFKGTASSAFYSRVGANQEGAAAGTFRLGIENSAWDSAGSVEFPQDLNLNQDYLVVLRLDLATDQSTLWVNPTDENSLSVTATDLLNYGTTNLINAFALRQGTTGTSPNVGAFGETYLDDLKVGTTFGSVMTALPVPEPSVLSLGLIGMAFVAWRRRN